MHFLPIKKKLIFSHYSVLYITTFSFLKNLKISICYKWFFAQKSPHLESWYLAGFEAQGRRVLLHRCSNLWRTAHLASGEISRTTVFPFDCKACSKYEYLPCMIHICLYFSIILNISTNHGWKMDLLLEVAASTTWM